MELERKELAIGQRRTVVTHSTQDTQIVLYMLVPTTLRKGTSSTYH